MRRAVLALACGLLLPAACAKPGVFGRPEPPVVTLSNLVPLDASPFEARVRADLRIQNPNDFEVAFDGLRFVLELNDAPFLRGVSNERVELPRLGEAVVSVEGTTTTFDVLRQLRSLASDPGAGLGYSLEGRLFVTEPRRIAVDFERSGRLDGWAKKP